MQERSSINMKTQNLTSLQIATATRISSCNEVM